MDTINALAAAKPAPARRRGRPAKGRSPRSDGILPAALACFAQHGFAGANLRQIAADASIDVALIAHRYGSKLKLWQAVVDDLAASFIRELSGRTEAAGNTLQQMLDQMVNVVCDRREVAMFIAKETALQDSRFDYFYERLIRPVHDLMLPLIPEDAAGTAAMDPNFFFFTITGSVAIAVVMRPFIGRFSPAAEDDAQFRLELKKILFQHPLFGFHPGG